MRYGHQPLGEVMTWPMTTLDRVARILSEQNEAMRPADEE